MAAVTIDKIDTYPLRIPLDTWAPPPMFAGGRAPTSRCSWCASRPSNGVVGWGESYGSSLPMLNAAFDNWIRHLAIGRIRPTRR